MTYITCPTCNYPTKIPDGGVAFLPRIIHLKQEAEQDKAIQRVTTSPPPECESCEEEGSVSVAYCTDCDHLLCKTCWTSHQKMKALQSHTTFALDDLEGKNQSHFLTMLTPSNSTNPLCLDHTDQKLIYYCMQCFVPVCVCCTLEKHKGHPVEEVKKQATFRKEEILQDLTLFQKGKEELEQATRSIQETMERLEKCKNEADSIIKETFTKLRKLIDQREKDLLAESNQVAVAKETRLTIQLEGIERLLESMRQYLSLASICTSQYSDVQLVSIGHTLHNRAIILQHQLTEVSFDPCESPHLQVDINTEELTNEISMFGGMTKESDPNVIAVLPRQRLGIGAEMKIRVILGDGTGKEPDGKVSSAVKCKLSCDSKSFIHCPVTDNGDGTCTVSVTPQQVGQHQLFISVNGQRVQGSPYGLSIMPHRNYASLVDPVQTITGIDHPTRITFTDNGDMFITSFSKCSIHVYDSNGRHKTTIGSRGSGELQFQYPYGIAVCGEVIYMAESVGHRIHKLTVGGEFLSVIGEKGSENGQFNGPQDVKISPTGKIYVADTGNDRVQVFNPDWTVSQVINGKVPGDGSFSCPFAIAFDLSSNVHVAGYDSNSVKVFNQFGQFMHQYDTKSPSSIVIDPSGYSLVTNCSNGQLSVFDSYGTFIHSVGGFKNPFGVSVSPAGSVWVADTLNYRVLKY